MPHYGGNKYSKYDFAFIAVAAGINNFHYRENISVPTNVGALKTADHAAVVCSNVGNK